MQVPAQLIIFKCGPTDNLRATGRAAGAMGEASMMVS